MPARRPARWLSVCAAAVLVTAMASACGTDSQETENTENTLVIGVSSTQPGLGVQDTDGRWSGFEVDLARYLAEGMGYTGSEVVFTAVVPANREQMLANGDVDLVLAQYPVPPEDGLPGETGTGDAGEDDGDRGSEDPTEEAEEPVVQFSTPYFTAHQDLLVRDDDGIVDLASMDDPERVLCSVTGSGKAQRVKDDYAPQVDLQEFDSYGLCVEALLEGRIDAVTTDDIVLAGYAEQHPDDLRVVGSLYAPEDYAVGLPVGSPYREQVDELVRRAVDDGTWGRLLGEDLGDAGWDPPPPPADSSGPA